MSQYEEDEEECRTCGRRITYRTVEEPGYLPRTGWADFHGSPLTCFQSIDFKHRPVGENDDS